MGPLIKTIMTRCIQCTRCVRFAPRSPGSRRWALLGRGEHLEITTLEKAIDSELSGNLVDVCPVGALTSKPYAFARGPWELRKTRASSMHGCRRLQHPGRLPGREVMRVLPRLHEGINEEWIADKTRHACDGLRRQRLDRPYVRNAEGKLKPASWEEAFQAIAAPRRTLRRQDRGPGRRSLRCRIHVRLKGPDDPGLAAPGLPPGRRQVLDPRRRAGYLFNTTIAGIEQADAVLLVGSNPRWEAPMINARLRKRFLKGGLEGRPDRAPADLSYPVEYLGAGPESLKALAAGEGAFAEVLKPPNGR